MLKGLTVNGVVLNRKEFKIDLCLCQNILWSKTLIVYTYNRSVGVEVLTILLSKVDIQAYMVDATNRQIVTIQSVTSVDRQIIVSVKRVLPTTAMYSDVILRRLC